MVLFLGRIYNLAMSLLLVESPKKARTIGGMFEDLTVHATRGHFANLPKKRLGVTRSGQNVNLEFVVNPKVRSWLKWVTKNYSSDNVYIGTDPDREGEAIAYHIYDIIGKGQRVRFHEITKSAIEQAISEAGTIDTPLVEAYFARRAIDRLIGYRLSPLLRYSYGENMAVGRVQSCVLYWLIEHERYLRHFVKKQMYRLVVQLSDGTIAKGAPLDEPDESLIEKATGGKAVFVHTEVSRNAPPPFTTASMLRMAHILRQSPPAIMSAAQSLFESGLITYHRTSSIRLSKAAVFSMFEYIKQDAILSQVANSKPKFWNSKGAHEAIRPVDVKHKSVQYGASAKLYDLIWRRSIASLCRPIRLEEQTVTIVHGDLVLAIAVGHKVLDPGWAAVYPYAKLQKPIDPDAKISSANIESFYTEPKAPYTESSAIARMEKLGVGRPSTYTYIFKALSRHEYLARARRSIGATKRAELTIMWLESMFPNLLSHKYTAQMEESLDAIAEGDGDWQSLVTATMDDISKLNKDDYNVYMEGVACPNCGCFDLSRPEVAHKGDPFIVCDSCEEWFPTLENFYMERSANG